MLDRPVTDGKPVEGKGAGYVEFANDGKPVVMQIATSFISHEQARRNLLHETVGGFEAIREKTAATWESLLSRIGVEGPEERKRTFYSCLFRALKYPRLTRRTFGEPRKDPRPGHHTPHGRGWPWTAVMHARCSA